MSRSRRRSHRYSERRSRSRSPRASTTTTDNHHKQQPQFIPVPVPYYQPANNPNSYLIPQATQKMAGENPPATVRSVHWNGESDR